ncbi:hypothetical protein NP493_7493g00002 [Ridgeia piscesae]|uniref:Uncharacterized protein n=1 Tax=Ridgeia piscesae TaxID=27915 RepID=A0AAD9IQ89_RIDPI|nr:hypothetical protein NP493_7493g00002 [Ridgeia piscesae]
MLPDMKTCRHQQWFHWQWFDEEVGRQWEGGVCVIIEVFKTNA